MRARGRRRHHQDSTAGAPAAQTDRISAFSTLKSVKKQHFRCSSNKLKNHTCWGALQPRPKTAPDTPSAPWAASGARNGMPPNLQVPFPTTTEACKDNPWDRKQHTKAHKRVAGGGGDARAAGDAIIKTAQLAHLPERPAGKPGTLKHTRNSTTHLHSRRRHLSAAACSIAARCIHDACSSLLGNLQQSRFQGVWGAGVGWVGWWWWVWVGWGG